MNETVSTSRVVGHVLENLPDHNEQVHHLLAAAVGGRWAVEDHFIRHQRPKRLAIALPNRAEQVHTAIMRPARTLRPPSRGSDPLTMVDSRGLTP